MDMDSSSQVPQGSQQNGSSSWTNEKHVRFLNSMEASFVRTMFENNNGLLLRLGRYLPDSSESTLDLKSQRRKKHATPDIIDSNVRMDGRPDKRSKRLHSPHPLQDQVVPQLESQAGDKDHRDPSN